MQKPEKKHGKISTRNKENSTKNLKNREKNKPLTKHLKLHDIFFIYYIIL